MKTLASWPNRYSQRQWHSGKIRQQKSRTCCALPTSFYLTETFFCAENGSTITILKFPVLGLTQQLVAVFSEQLKHPGPQGMWRPVKQIAANPVFLWAPGCESLTQWPPLGICLLVVIDLSFIKWRCLTFLRDACLIAHNSEITLVVYRAILCDPSNSY